MREGSLEAPKRHPIPWQDEAWLDPEAIDAELRRVFDICHGCRRCFNLCDSFPRLFDLIDASKTGELDAVDSADFKPVAEACTLCDMCFMTKCPYVPPHAFDLDFPHLMLRARAAEAHRLGMLDRRLAATDTMGALGTLAAPLANWVLKRGNAATRPILEKIVGFDREAELPRYESHRFTISARTDAPEVNHAAPAAGRKVVLFATCWVNNNDAAIGHAALGVLARNGIKAEVLHPGCCGMPLLEQGRLADVAEAAKRAADAFAPWIEKGYDVVAPIPSCGLMLKFEWPLVLPEHAGVKTLAAATFDICEYVVDIARKEGLAPGLSPLPGGVAVHMACHARAQNMGQKAAEMLRLIPGADIGVVERCSGHGGSWGFRHENFPVAMKVGRPAARALQGAGKPVATSECPLAAMHLGQAMQRQAGDAPVPEVVSHPIILMARAYGVEV